MKNQLPDGFSVRPPAMEDAQAVTNLVAAHDMDEFGKIEYGINDLLPMWRRKNFDLTRDARMIFAPDGTLAGYCDMNYRNGVTQLDNISCAHPAYRNQGIEDWILEFAEEWAQEHVAPNAIVLRHVLNADAPVRTARIERWGYHAVRNAWIMHIDLDRKPVTPQVPAGIVVRPFERGRDERLAWMCIQEAFRDLWQHQDSPFDEWAGFILGHASWSPELSYLAFDGELIAGATITMNDENGGWIQQVGVRRPWRSRGIGLALLDTIFSEMFKRGIAHAGLEVDAENPSGALRLYQRAGMRVDKHFTEYRKELRVPVPTPA